MVIGAALWAFGAAETSAGDALKDLAAFTDCDACPVMVVIPGGTFEMGAPWRRERAGEGPERDVTVQRFAIGKYEVSFDEWAACVADGFCASNTAPEDEEWGRGRRPAINVSWDDVTGARGFAAWLNSKVDGAPYRLPTEAEWEYAASGGASVLREIGPELQENAWHEENSRGRTHPVGLKRPNGFGLHDMIGNALEWVQDCENWGYNDAPTDGSAWMAGDCDQAMIRGGGYNYPEFILRITMRTSSLRFVRNQFYGFRIAKSLD